MSFTPGPWTVDKDGDVTASGWYLCHPRGTGDSNPRIDEEAEANARLIAAAPKLLKSCEELLSLAREWGKNPTYYTQAEANIIGLAEDAIAEATGGAL